MFIMKNPQTVIFEPNEYKTAFELKSFGMGFIPAKGIVITKNGENIFIPTVLNVDSGCRIRVTRSGNGAARVKHLTSTPRRNYYMFLMWFTLIFWALGWIFTLYEVLVNGNYAVGDSRTRHAMLVAFGAWMGLDIVVLRNGHGFNRWSITIFSYGVLAICILSFIRYLVRLFQGI